MYAHRTYAIIAALYIIDRIYTKFREESCVRRIRGIRRVEDVIAKKKNRRPTFSTVPTTRPNERDDLFHIIVGKH